jgi:hypothetical protein
MTRATSAGAVRRTNYAHILPTEEAAMRNPIPLAAILLTLTACTATTTPEEPKAPAAAGQVVGGSMPMDSMPMDMGSTADKKAQTPLTTDQIAFENLKKLVGRWEAPLGKNKTIVDTFQPFAFGSAILAEEWIGEEQITSTVFYMVGSQLRADHFCDYLNQPRYVARTSADPAVIDFEFREATNLETHATHFHSTTWRFIDADHLTQEWRIEGSPKGNSTVHLDFVRKSQAS